MLINVARRYVIISPVRNEAQYLERTIESVISQTVLPAEYTIVNDGSTDETEAIIRRYAAKYPWIRLVNRPDRGFRKTGAGVVDAFYTGFQAIKALDWEYVVKLDGDLRLIESYFAQMLEHFDNMPRLGIGGGYSYYEVRGRRVLEWVTEDHVRGAVKMYRRSCFDEIGGLESVLGWDVLDEIRSRMKGWETKSFQQPYFILNRTTGGPVGLLRTRVRDGYFAWYRGSSALYVFAKGIRRMATAPYLLGGVVIIASYWYHRLRGEAQFADQELLDFVYREQLAYLRRLPKLLFQRRLF